MSDYLGHLLERSFAPTPAVRPQNLSLFEPAPVTRLTEQPSDIERAAESETTGPAHPAREQTQDTSLSRSSNPPTTPQKFETPRPDGVTLTPTDDSHLRTLDASRTRSVPPVATFSEVNRFKSQKSFRTSSLIEPASDETPIEITKPGFVQTPARVMSSEIAQIEAVSAIPTNPPHAHSRNFETTFPTVSRLPREADEPTEDQCPNPSRDIRKDSPMATTKVPASPLHTTGKIIHQTAVMQPASVAGHVRNGHATDESNSSPAPTIQVTIGRVEVRATTTPSIPVHAKAKREPEMSLDAYLQRRAEGGRR